METKNLILIRHGKSSWELPLQDINRDLSKKGIDNSYKIANLVADIIDRKSTIILSAAKRTIETARIFMDVWRLNFYDAEIKKELYTFDSIQLEQIVKSSSNDINNLILFGHNSAITDFVNKFGTVYIENVPTSGFVSIRFETHDWNSISKGITNNIIFPSHI